MFLKPDSNGWLKEFFFCFSFEIKKNKENEILRIKIMFEIKKISNNAILDLQSKFIRLYENF